MAEPKTKATDASVDTYIDAIDDERRRVDCRAIAAIMKRLTKHQPKMWGPSIVGFGSYHYKYASGHEGDAALTGFSSRASNLCIYIVAGFERHEKLMATLGKHKIGKSCLYVMRLADIDVAALEILIGDSVAEMKRRYPA